MMNEGYYVGDRMHYQQTSTPIFQASYGGGSGVGSEEERKGGRLSGCMVCLGLLFTLLILLILAALVLFFTVGRGGIGFGSAASAKAQPRIANNLQRDGSSRGSGGLLSAGHNDFASAGYVLTAVETGRYRVCLFDTAYLAADPIALFNQQHIRSARHFNIDRIITATTTKRRELVHPLVFQAYVRSLGVDKNCLVVLYDHGEKDVSQMTATFVWWAFKVYGHHKVAVLNGGLRRWQAEGFNLTSQRTPTAQEGDFVAGWDPEWVVSIDDVIRGKDSVGLLDARTPTDFAGETAHKLARRPGRIAGATNIPIRTLLNDQGGLQPVAELSKRFREDYSLPGRKPLVVYCNTGLQSSLLLFSLAQAGIPARNYDGGWVEFSHLGPQEMIAAG